MACYNTIQYTTLHYTTLHCVCGCVSTEPPKLQNIHVFWTINACKCDLLSIITWFHLIAWLAKYPSELFWYSVLLTLTWNGHGLSYPPTPILVLWICHPERCTADYHTLASWRTYESSQPIRYIVCHTSKIEGELLQILLNNEKAKAVLQECFIF